MTAARHVLCKKTLPQSEKTTITRAGSDASSSGRIAHRFFRLWNHSIMDGEFGSVIYIDRYPSCPASSPDLFRLRRNAARTQSGPRHTGDKRVFRQTEHKRRKACPQQPVPQPCRNTQARRICRNWRPAPPKSPSLLCNRLRQSPVAAARRCRNRTR